MVKQKDKGAMIQRLLFNTFPAVRQITMVTIPTTKEFPNPEFNTQYSMLSLVQ